MKKILLAMMIVGTLFSADAKTKSIPNKTRLATIKKVNNTEISDLYKKAQEVSKLYKSATDTKKKAILKRKMTDIIKEIDLQLSSIDPKYNALLEEIEAANTKNKNK